MSAREPSALRIYVGRNKVGLALAGAVLAALGVGGKPLADRMISGAEAQTVALAVVKRDVALLQEQQAELARTQQLQRNTLDRIDATLGVICEVMAATSPRPVRCPPRPPRPE